jgi:hypothetical protein
MNACRLLVLLLVLCGAAHGAPAGIGLSLAADDALMVQYRFPPGVRTLRFAMQDGQVWQRVRKARWRVQEDCALLEAGGLTRDSVQHCEVVHVRVTPGLLGLDRRFEPAQPMGQGALVLHTRYYAASGDDPAAIWTVQAPPGGTAFWLGAERPAGGETLAPTPATGLQAQIDDTTLVLTRRPFERWRGLLALTADLPEAQRAEIRLSAETLLDEYRHGFGAPPGNPLLLVAGVRGEAATSSTAQGARPSGDERGAAGRSAAAGVRPRGDVQDGAVRMTLEYSGSALGDRERGVLRVFLAHELFHLWHGRRFHGSGEAWLGEGNADWIALNTLQQMGWMNDSVYILLLEQAFNECAAGIGAQAWSLAPQRQGGILPYRCGLAFHAMAFEAARREGNSASPLDQWRAILSGGPLDESTFFGWYARPDFGGARLNALRQLLAADTPFAAGLLPAMRAAGVSFELAPALSWLPAACGGKARAIEVNCLDRTSVQGGYIHLGIIGSAKSRIEILQ